MFRSLSFWLSCVALFAIAAHLAMAACPCDYGNPGCVDLCINTARSCMTRCNKKHSEDKCYEFCMDRFWPTTGAKVSGSPSSNSEASSNVLPPNALEAAESERGVNYMYAAMPMSAEEQGDVDKQEKQDNAEPSPVPGRLEAASVSEAQQRDEKVVTVEIQAVSSSATALTALPSHSMSLSSSASYTKGSQAPSKSGEYAMSDVNPTFKTPTLVVLAVAIFSVILLV